MIETDNYWITNNKFIFKPDFDGSINTYIDLMSQYNELIFSNYDCVGLCIKSNNEYKDKCCKYCEYYQKSIFDKKVELPENLTHLTFGFNFNQEIKLPPNLTHLTFGELFNQKVVLPSNLTHLTFGYRFNQEIKLPPNLTHLTFGEEFNQKVELPNSIKYLNLNSNNKSVIDCLPDNLEELVLGHYFNLELNDLKSSIKKIKCSHRYEFMGSFSKIKVDKVEVYC
jgi:hypothetical protein